MLKFKIKKGVALLVAGAMQSYGAIRGYTGICPANCGWMTRNIVILQGSRKKYIKIYWDPQISILRRKGPFLCMMQGYPCE